MDSISRDQVLRIKALEMATRWAAERGFPMTWVQEQTNKFEQYLRTGSWS